MSTQENAILEENAWEAFESGLANDSDFRATLTKKLLDGMEYCFYCKEDAYKLLQDRLEDFFKVLLSWDFEATVRDPVEAAKRYLYLSA